VTLSYTDTVLTDWPGKAMTPHKLQESCFWIRSIENECQVSQR
jgi:hypothetical protein